MEALKDIPNMEAALLSICGSLGYGLGAIPEYIDRKHRREILDERLDVIRSVMKLACKTGDQEIASTYNNQVGWYHVYGACRTAIVVILIATAMVIAGKQGHEFAANLGRSLPISVLLVILGGGSWQVFGVRRQRIRSSITRQLTCDLRAWAIQHPELWARLADVNAGQLPSAIQIHRRHQQVQA